MCVRDSPDGHRSKTVLQSDILTNSIVFYCGGMGEFDAICAGVVRSIKKAHKDRRMQNAGGES